MNPIIKDIWLTRLALTLWIIAALSLMVILARMAAGFVPAIVTIPLVCNPSQASEQILAYRFYERINNTWVFLGHSPTNGFKVTNVVSLIPHTYGVSASNAIGESDISAPYISPTDPHPPLRLHSTETNALVLDSTFNGGVDWFPVVTFIGTTTNLSMQRAQMFRSSRTNFPPLPK